MAYIFAMKSLHRRLPWALAAALLFLVEVLIATLWAQVPFVRTDLGDYLVVLLLYCMAKCVKDFAPTPLALGILVFSFCVEFAQYFHVADRLGFARGSLPSIVIGTTFHVGDLAMYTAGCLTAWLLDRKIRSRREVPA